MSMDIGVVAEPAAAVSPAEETRRERFRKHFLRNRTATGALVILTLITAACLLAPWVAPYDPLEGNVTDRLLPLGAEGHVLGTDEQGRDILSRILYGGRISLLAGVAPVLIAVWIGGCLGVVAAFFGGWLNAAIMRSLDIFYSFPAVLLAIGISSALGPGIDNIIVALAIVFIPPIARVTESAVKTVLAEEFIEAARSSGASAASIITHHVIPNIFSKVFVYGTTQISISLVMASGLSFLGLGISPPTPEWGIILNNLKQQIYINPVVTIIPGFFIFISALTINLVSDGLRDALESK